MCWVCLRVASISFLGTSQSGRDVKQYELTKNEDPTTAHYQPACFWFLRTAQTNGHISLGSTNPLHRFSSVCEARTPSSPFFGLVLNGTSKGTPPRHIFFWGGGRSSENYASHPDGFYPLRGFLGTMDHDQPQVWRKGEAQTCSGASPLVSFSPPKLGQNCCLNHRGPKADPVFFVFPP